MKLILILQIASTLILVGVIWTIQLVHYPSFRHIRSENFQKHHQSHTFWITPIVAPAMLIELFTSILLIFYPPQILNYKLIWSGLILIIINWASTAFVQIPLHNKLGHGFDEQIHTKLVNSNWIRTIAWTLRGSIVLHFTSVIIHI